MTAAFYLWCLFGLLGALDVGYFHIYRCKLSSAPGSRGEQVTHLARTALFVAVLLWLMGVEAHGPAALILPGLLAADFLNSMADVLLEPKSRQALGGLPPLEYAVHMVAMFVSGAATALVVVDAWSRLALPARLALTLLAVPPAALAMGWQIALVAVGLFVFEGLRFLGVRR
mgnify:CR=1 FL=1